MPRIASHHVGEEPGHTPRDEWPADCLVQWGADGLVIGDGDSYTTAFFEAFPEGSFIRGEGATISEAEMDALIQWRMISACKEHLWSRKEHRNGVATCRRCGKLAMVMKPVHGLGEWRAPLTVMEIEYALGGFLMSCREAPYPSIEGKAGAARRRRKQWLRLRWAGFMVPPLPEGKPSIEERRNHPHTLATREAIMKRIDELGGVAALEGTCTTDPIIGFLTQMGSRSLRRAYAEWRQGRN